MPVNVKRFRIFNAEYQSRVFEADTTKEIYNYLKKQDTLYVIPELFIDDVIDGIEVSAEDFLELLNRGETPEDLQMF